MADEHTQRYSKTVEASLAQYRMQRWLESNVTFYTSLHILRDDGVKVEWVALLEDGDMVFFRDHVEHEVGSDRIIHIQRDSLDQICTYLLQHGYGVGNEKESIE